jgi:hypothetical protein
MWLHATIEGPSAGTFSSPSKCQVNQSLIGGSATAFATWYQGSSAQTPFGQTRRISCHAPGSRPAASKSFIVSPTMNG